MVLQQKLNDIIQAHQSNPENNGMFVRGRGINGFAPHSHQSGKLRLAPTSALTPVYLKIKATFHHAAKHSLAAALTAHLNILSSTFSLFFILISSGNIRKQKIKEAENRKCFASACHQNYNLIRS